MIVFNFSKAVILVLPVVFIVTSVAQAELTNYQEKC